MLKRIISEIGIACLVFTGLDSIWLMLIMKTHYDELITKIQGSPMEPNFIAAILCYIVLIGGLYYFVIHQSKEFNVWNIISLSVPYGIVTYGTFDFTTATILKNWDLGTAFLDVAWGAVLCTLTSLSVLYYRHNFCETQLSEEHVGDRSQ